MGWSVTDWTPGNIQKYADEFWKALNKRRIAIGGSLVYVPIAGANIQSGFSSTPTNTSGSFGWKFLQEQIASLCKYFVQSHDLDGTPRSTDYYAGKTTIEMWTFPNLMQAVRGGTPQSDFRRATTYPTDWTDWSDTAYSAGKITLGTPRDILGPWIPSDIQKAFNMLIWSAVSNFEYGLSVPNGFSTRPLIKGIIYSYSDDDEYNGSCGNSNDTWEEILAAAESDWARDTGHEMYVVWHGPRKYSARSHGNRYGKSAWMEEQRTFVYIDNLPEIAREIDCYILAQAPDIALGDDISVFDALGESIAENKWSLVTSFASSSTSTATSDYIISSAFGTMPPWGGTPTPPPAYPPDKRNYSWRGFSAGYFDGGNAAAIMRWNVSGGFDYV